MTRNSKTNMPLPCFAFYQTVFPAFFLASWIQVSLDCTPGHHSCFRYWNKLPTHYLLPLKWLIFPSLIFPLLLLLLLISVENSISFFIQFVKAAEQSLLSPLGSWKCAMVTLHTWRDFPHSSWRCFFSSMYINEKAQEYNSILKSGPIILLWGAGKFWFAQIRRE